MIANHNRLISYVPQPLRHFVAHREGRGEISAPSVPELRASVAEACQEAEIASACPDVHGVGRQHLSDRMS